MSTDKFINEKHLLESEIDHLHTMNRLEPDLSPAEGESYALTSAAISLKRLADSFDREPREQRMEGHEIKMTSALWDRYVSKGSAAFSAAMKAIDDYFKDKNP